MGKVLIVAHKDTRRRSQVETQLAEAEKMREQYKHNALLHRLHTINCEYIRSRLAQRDLWHTDKGALLKEKWAIKKHIQQLNNATRD